jgi:tetratricopeptide (TPR) repeat protein
VRRFLSVPFVLVAVVLALGSFSTAWAQTDSVAALRELLGGGYYALAAQVEGPQAVETHPQNAEAHLLYARALYLVGNIEAARAQLAEAKTLTATPELSRARTHLDALVRAARGDSANAARLLASVFEAAPDYRVAMDWGQVAWQGGDLKTALRAYRAAAVTEEGAREPWPSLNIARLLLQQGRFEAAIAPLETTLTLLERDPNPIPSPAYTEAFYRLGQAHEALGEVEEAVSNYQATRSVDPDYAPAEDALARLENP